MGSCAKKWTESEIEFLRQNYNKNSIREMANALGRNYNATKTKVFKLGISDTLSKRGVKKYSFDENYFAEVNMNSAYWAGFILADGHGDLEKRVLKIKLANQDICQLEKFKKDLNFNGPFYKNLKQNQTSIGISSLKILQDLEKNFDIKFKGKTYNAVPPTKLAVQHQEAFLIGLIDGDGSINVAKFKGKNGKIYPKNRIQLIATEEVCKWAKTLFEQICKEKIGKLFKVKTTKSCYTVSTCGRKADLIIDYLKEVNCHHMERKWSKK